MLGILCQEIKVFVTDLWILLMYSKLEPQNDFDKIFVHSEVDSQGRKWKILN